MVRRGPRATVAAFAVALASAACGGGGNPSWAIWPPEGGAAGADAGQGGSDEARFQPLVDAVEAERQQLGASGVALAIVEHGQVTFARGFGPKHAGTDDPVLPTTLFMIASNTKKHTTVALLQLVEQGLVDFAEPVTDIDPAFDFALEPGVTSSIVVQNLLTHESAMADLWGNNHLSVATFLHDWYAQNGHLLAPPGAMWNYSNPPFVLAGHLIEALTGQSYPDYMRQHVYGPLGMARTVFRAEDAMADGDVAWPGFSVPTMSPCVEDCWAGPAAGAYSSVLDEALFMRFLREGDLTVLGSELQQAMQQPQVSTHQVLDLISYGYGLFVRRGLFLDDGATFYDLVALQHHGRLVSPNYLSDFWYFPDLDFGFITMAVGSSNYFDHSLEVALETLCDLPAPATPPDLTVDSATFGAYVGEYFDPFEVGTIFVTQQADELRVTMPALDQAGVAYDPVLVPTVPDNFELTLAGAVVPVTFILDAQGVGRYFRTRQFVGGPPPTAGAPAAPSAAPTQHLPAPPGERLTAPPGPARLLRALALEPPEPQRLWLSGTRRARSAQHLDLARPGEP